ISVTALSFVGQAARGLGQPAVPQREVDRCDTIVERMMMRWRGELNPAHGKAVDAYFVSAAEHGMNASTLTPAVVAGTRRRAAAWRAGGRGVAAPGVGGGDAGAARPGGGRPRLARGGGRVGWGPGVSRGGAPRAGGRRPPARARAPRRYEVADALEQAAIAEL